MPNPNVNLHDYQVYAKDFVLSHPYCGLFLKMGLGKACDNETWLPTPDGTCRQVKDIRPGDFLIGKDGRPTKVLAIYPQEKKTAYRVTLEDRRSFVCCDEHLVPYLENGTVKNKPLKDMLPDYHAGNKFRYRIPLCDPVEFPEQGHDVDPAVMARLVTYGNYEKSIQDPKIRKQLETSGLWTTPIRERFLPREYLFDNIPNRRKLLSTLFLASDGSCSVCTVKSRHLASDIQWICHSLGYDVRTTATETGDRREYRISVPAEPKRHPSVPIVDIERVPDRDMTCFTVDAPDQLYLIGDFIVTHNTLITLDSLYDLNPTMHVLVIAPKTIARCTWINEIEENEYPFRTRSLIVNERGKQLSKKKREEIYDTIPSSPATMYFINRELVPSLVQYFPKDKWPFGIVIVDESQSFKSHKSARFKSLQSVRPWIFRLVELTGSPAPNGPMDLWSQIYLLDMGERLGRNITAYRDQYFLPGLIVNNYPVTWYPRPGAEDAIYGRISDLVISMKNDRIKLPEITYHQVQGVMDPDQMKRYKSFLKDFVLDLADGGYVEASNAAVLQGKLSQIASGAIYKDVGSHDYEIIHDVKLNLCEYIVNNADDNVLVAYYFQSDRQMLLDYFKERDVPAVCFDGSPEMLRAWNEGKLPVLLIQPASCGFGLNFQKGGHTLVWYTLPWSLEQYEQTNARIYRQGQTEHTMVHHLIMKGTVDTKILRALERKNVSQQALIEAVQATINDD